MKSSGGRRGGNPDKRGRGIAATKHDEDLERNPGVGQSVGTSQGGDIDLIEGENRVEGDPDNNAGRRNEIGRERIDK